MPITALILAVCVVSTIGLIVAFVWVRSKGW